jgi:hypothetical protein
VSAARLPLLITLTTDFGHADWFVGAMKGVILGQTPGAMIVDLTHAVPSGDIRAGAFALLAGCRCFPPGTVHVAVVDPSVGSSRPALAVRTTDYYFLGPDNGVLSFALARERVQAVRRIENERLFRQPVSASFHGRDVFAPVAAYLAGGGDFARVGPEAGGFVRLRWPEPQVAKEGWTGEVIYVDHFGNAITNLGPEQLGGRAPQGVELMLPGRKRCPLAACYQAAPVGQPLGLIGSCGLLEVAVNRGSAARSLGLRVGSKVQVRFFARPSRGRSHKA